MSHLTCSHRHIGSRPRSVISPHPIHACALGCFLSVFFLLSFYLLPKSFFHLFLIPAMVPDENSMNDPLCNSAIGSMVSLDYVTPDTLCVGQITESPFQCRRNHRIKHIEVGEIVSPHNRSRCHKCVCTSVLKLTSQL